MNHNHTPQSENRSSEDIFKNDELSAWEKVQESARDTSPEASEAERRNQIMNDGELSTWEKINELNRDNSPEALENERRQNILSNPELSTWEKAHALRVKTLEEEAAERQREILVNPDLSSWEKVHEMNISEVAQKEALPHDSHKENRTEKSPEAPAPMQPSDKEDKPMFSDKDLGNDEVDQITPAIYDQIKQQSKDLSIDGSSDAELLKKWSGDSDNVTPETPTPLELNDKEVANGMQEVIRKAEANKADRENYKQNFISNYPEIKLEPVSSRLQSPSYYGGVISRFSRLHNKLKSRLKSEKETFKHQDIVQYDDEQLSLEFKKKGDVLQMGPGSEHKYAKNFSLKDMAIITTKSGKEYGLVKGFIIDRSSGKVSKLPSQAINLVIGKKGELPGIGKIDRVKNVQLRYKIEDDQTAERRFDQNPFKYYEQLAAEQSKDES